MTQGAHCNTVYFYKWKRCTSPAPVQRNITLGFLRTSQNTVQTIIGGVKKYSHCSLTELALENRPEN